MPVGGREGSRRLALSRAGPSNQRPEPSSSTFDFGAPLGGLFPFAGVVVAGLGGGAGGALALALGGGATVADGSGLAASLVACAVGSAGEGAVVAAGGATESWGAALFVSGSRRSRAKIATAIVTVSKARSAATKRSAVVAPEVVAAVGPGRGAKGAGGGVPPTSATVSTFIVDTLPVMRSGGGVP